MLITSPCTANRKMMVLKENIFKLKTIHMYKFAEKIYLEANTCEPTVKAKHFDTHSN